MTPTLKEKLEYYGFALKLIAYIERKITKHLGANDNEYDNSLVIEHKSFPKMDFVTEKCLVILIKNCDSNNLHALHSIAKIIARLAQCRLIQLEGKNTTTLVSLVNQVFGLQESLLGAEVTRFLSGFARDILSYLLRRRNFYW